MTTAEALAALLGPDAVSSERRDLDGHAGDLSPGTLLKRRAGQNIAPPACVVRPRSADEVAEVLRWADETGTPVVPFGAGSSVCEGISSTGRAVVVDLEKMDRVSVDEESLLVTCQAGVRGDDLDASLRATGHMLGHQPQSIAISSVGGWIATRACGQLSSGYGGIEDVLVSIEAVLPGGKVARSKVVPRRSAGPDVAALMIGSEGSLGVVTEATLQIAPVPEESAHLALEFEGMTDGVAACRRLAQSELSPALVRLYDENDAAIFFRNHPDPPGGPLLLLTFHGEHALERARVAQELGGHPEDPGWVEYWWEHRNAAVDDYERIFAGKGALGPHALVDTMEVSGTWSALRSLYHGLKVALEAEADLVGCHLSHVYPSGACLYFTLASACSDDEAAARSLSRWWEVGMRTCLDAGGAISHHHGIGRVKSRWLREELDGWWEVLAAVKRAVDPKGIMNPGVLGLGNGPSDRPGDHGRRT